MALIYFDLRRPQNIHISHETKTPLKKIKACINYFRFFTIDIPEVTFRKSNGLFQILTYIHIYRKIYARPLTYYDMRF